MENKKFYGMYIDFDEMRDAGIFPCDLDFTYLCYDGFLILSEFKNSLGYIKGMQRTVLTNIVDNHCFGGILLDTVHDKFQQKGDTEVNAADCIVRSYYYDRQWHSCDRNFKEFVTELVTKHNSGIPYKNRFPVGVF